MKKFWVSTSSGRIEFQMTVEQAQRVAAMGDVYSDTAAIVTYELESEYKDIAINVFGLYVGVNRDPRGASLKLHDSGKDVESGMGTVL